MTVIDIPRAVRQHAAMAERELPEHDSDYDGAWKEALRNHLPECVEKYFPRVHATIDWTAELQWFDKEVSQVLGQPGSRNRTVDVLVKVRLRSGDEQWILVHLEIQTSFETDFAERIALYNSGLFWTFRQRVATLVILADLRRDWRSAGDLFELADFRSHLEFPVCKLIERLATDWRDDRSLPVLLARAQVEALRTAGNPEERYRAKWRLVRGLYDLGYIAEEVRELFRLIDWMMHLREDLSERFKVDLDQLEEELTMPYVTSVERLAKAEGIARVVLRVLRRGCGELPGQLEGRIAKLSLDQLEELQEQMFNFQQADEIARWLDELSNNQTK